MSENIPLNSNQLSQLIGSVLTLQYPCKTLGCQFFTELVISTPPVLSRYDIINKSIASMILLNNKMTREQLGHNDSLLTIYSDAINVYSTLIKYYDKYGSGNILEGLKASGDVLRLKDIYHGINKINSNIHDKSNAPVGSHWITRSTDNFVYFSTDRSVNAAKLFRQKDGQKNHSCENYDDYLSVVAPNAGHNYIIHKPVTDHNDTLIIENMSRLLKFEPKLDQPTSVDTIFNFLYERTYEDISIVLHTGLSDSDWYHKLIKGIFSDDPIEVTSDPLGSMDLDCVDYLVLTCGDYKRPFDNELLSNLLNDHPNLKIIIF